MSQAELTGSPDPTAAATEPRQPAPVGNSGEGAHSALERMRAIREMESAAPAPSERATDAGRAKR